MKILVSAGEVSGDVHGAYLVKELKKLRPDIYFFGMGSERLAAEGVDIRLDITNQGTIGIFEALPNLLPIYSAFSKMTKLLTQEKPDLVLLIDSQGFNLPLAKFCKKAGIKTVYYIAPQEWLWGSPAGVKKVSETIDLIVAIFEKEYAVYKKAGANVVYFGHPLVDIVQPTLSKEAARKTFLGIDARIVNRQTTNIIALCPGSRTREIKNLFPILLKAAEVIQKSKPNVFFIIPAASKDVANNIKTIISHYKIVENQTYDVLNASDLAICTSGTINLEASLLGIPNIMIYKLSPLTYFIGKHILKIGEKLKYFSMPNILMNEKIIPELIMDEANPERIAQEALAILKNNDQASRLLALRKMLGAAGVVARCAAAILML